MNPKVLITIAFFVLTLVVGIGLIVSGNQDEEASDLSHAWRQISTDIRMRESGASASEIRDQQSLDEAAYKSKGATKRNIGIVIVCACSLFFVITASIYVGTHFRNHGHPSETV